MDEKYELKTLNQIATLVEAGQRPPQSSIVTKYAFYVLGVVLIVSDYLLASFGHISAPWSVVIAALGGAFVGLASYMDVALKQWPVLLPHINTESLQKRLRTLDLD